MHKQIIGSLKLMGSGEITKIIIDKLPDNNIYQLSCFYPNAGKLKDGLKSGAYSHEILDLKNPDRELVKKVWSEGEVSVKIIWDKES